MHIYHVGDLVICLAGQKEFFKKGALLELQETDNVRWWAKALHTPYQDRGWYISESQFILATPLNRLKHLIGVEICSI